MNKKILLTAGFLGATAILLGAFGAHALKKVLTVTQLATFETGVRYQMYHALFLIMIYQMNFLSEKAKKIIYYLIFIGVLLFSGSIYLFISHKRFNFN